jgi:hypothetical protein
MTSLLTSVKTTLSDTEYFIGITALTGQVYGLNPTSNTFSTASWAFGGPGLPVSTINRAGAILKDMGKTVVSSNRTFRKVQLVSHSVVAGVAGANLASAPYLSGYIELSSGSNQAAASGAAPAPVAYLPGLL